MRSNFTVVAGGFLCPHPECCRCSRRSFRRRRGHQHERPRYHSWRREQGQTGSFASRYEGRGKQHERPHYLSRRGEQGQTTRL